MSSSTADDAASLANELGGAYFDDDTESQLPPRRLLRAEMILSQRTSRFLLVLETLTDANNYQAILRTAEAFGVQNVWVVESGRKKKHAEKVQQQMEEAAAVSAAAGSESAIAAASSSSSAPSSTTPHISDIAGSVSMSSGRWLSLRYFNSTSDCITALREDKREIWVTALHPGCQPLDSALQPLPDRLALILGRELDGVSKEMISAASKCVFLPMYGFSESFNVSVAGALVCQRLFDLAPDARGKMSEEERMVVRRQFYQNLSLGTPGAEADYMQHWLPRYESTIAHMKTIVETQGAASLLRPLEETRRPLVHANVRRKMEKEGQRSVNTQR